MPRRKIRNVVNTHRKAFNARVKAFNRNNRRLVGNKIYTFKQSVDGVKVDGVGSRFIYQTNTAQEGAIFFTLGDLNQASSFTTIFDQYRIIKVKISFMPMCNLMGIVGTATATGAAAGAATPGVFATVVDYDDANTLGSFNAYEEYETFKVQPAVSGRIHTRTLRPHLAMAVYQASAFTAYANAPSSQWLDCANTSTQYYGVKYYLDAYLSATAVQSWQVFATYWVQFKNVR